MSDVGLCGRHVILDNYDSSLWRFNLMSVSNHSFLTTDDIVMNVLNT